MLSAVAKRETVEPKADGSMLRERVTFCCSGKRLKILHEIGAEMTRSFVLFRIYSTDIIEIYQNIA